MKIIKKPNRIIYPIFRAEFVCTPAYNKKIQKSISDEIVKDRLTGNIVEVGEPLSWNLKELYERKGLELSTKTKLLFNKFDFWLIQSAFSFSPAPGNEFEWARIVAKMELLSDNKSVPIAYDAYPRDIFQEKDKKNHISIGLNLKFQKVINAEAKYVQDIELTKLEPVISVAGIGTSKPTWDFRKKSAFYLKNVNALYIILKTPINAQGIKISYFSHAHISTKWGGLIPTSTKPTTTEIFEFRF